MIDRTEFAPQKVVYFEGGRRIERYAIVLRDKFTKAVITITDLADYLLYKSYDDAYMFRATHQDIVNVCHALNFIVIRNSDRWGVRSVADITIEMLQTFMTHFCSTESPLTGEYRSRQACDKMRKTISMFFEALAKDKCKKMKHIKYGELIHQVTNTNGSKPQVIYLYKLRCQYYTEDNGLKSLYRDMPVSVAEQFLIEAEHHDPEILFAIALQQMAGLREGEVCNVRRADSSLGQGITVTTMHETIQGVVHIKPTGMSIDLMKEDRLRTDGTSVGRIKRERICSVYETFVEKLYGYYLKHLTLIQHKPCEATRPMFLSKNIRNGIYMAMTISGYRQRIQALFVNHVLPSLQDAQDPDIQVFLLQMRNHTWGAHAFRHFFTVRLLEAGVDNVEQLQHLRGDRSPRSAETYLLNKGVLLKKFRSAVGQMYELGCDDRKEQ